MSDTLTDLANALAGIGVLVNRVNLAGTNGDAVIADAVAALTAAAEREAALREAITELGEALGLETAALIAERQQVKALREHVNALMPSLSNPVWQEGFGVAVQTVKSFMDALGLPSPNAPQPPGTTRETP